MIKWLKSLFEDNNETTVKQRRNYKSRRHLSKNEVLAISKDIHMKKNRKAIKLVYNISDGTYYKIKNGLHYHQASK